MVAEGWRDGREVRGRAARLGAGKPERRETDKEERERENDFIGAVACSGNGHHAWYLFNMV